MYFIIFRTHTEDKYRHYTNELFQTEKDATDFANRSFKRKQKDLWKVVYYDSENVDKYWW